MRELYHFLLHLRPHYQLTVLSGGYLLSLLWLPDPWDGNYWIQFLNVHLLLYGGATAFNSYWDKDEGPVGGLKSPPKMKPWMRNASLMLMSTGQIWALLSQSMVFNLFYGVSFFLFWIYSSPIGRWKGKPVLSLVIIAVSTGTNAFWMGLEAGGVSMQSLNLLSAGCGAGLVLVSMYPVSQYFQIEEDRARGDVTFTIQFGRRGVQWFFAGSFTLGMLFMIPPLWQVNSMAATVLALTSIIPLIVVWRVLNNLSGTAEEYRKVMILKFVTSFSFVLTILFFAFIW